MSSRLRRGAGLAVLTSMIGTLGLAAPAHAATTPAADAYVVSADAISGIASVAPTPESTYPPGGTNSVAGLTAGPFATDATLTATTAGSVTDGTSNASATVNDLGVDLGTLGTIALTGVDSTCTATPAGATGSGVIDSGTVTVLGVPVATLTPDAAPNTTVNVAGLGTITLNEQATAADGTLVVNAMHLQLLPDLGGANLIVGHAQCAGAPAAPSGLTVTKSAAETSFTAGQTIHYSYEVTNSGAQNLTGVAVTDNGPGNPAVTCPEDTLAAGASETCTASYTATPEDVTRGSVTDTATATATTSDATTVTANSNEVTIPAQSVGITPPQVTLRAVPTSYNRSGEQVVWHIRVTNTGTSTLHDLTVTLNGDDRAPVFCNTPALAAGESADCVAVTRTTADDVRRGHITDSATVAGTMASGATATNTSDEVTLNYTQPNQPGQPGRPGHPGHPKPPVHHHPGHPKPPVHRHPGR